MARSFIATASHSTGGVTTAIATGAAIKTVLQVGTPSTAMIRVWGWGISFDGATSTAVPGICNLVDTYAIGATGGTTLTADQGLDRFQDVGDAVSGTTCMVNETTEGAIVAARVLDSQHVHPQTGYSIWFPTDCRPKIDVSKFLRVRTTFAATVNCIPWIVWDE